MNNSIIYLSTFNISLYFATTRLILVKEESSYESALQILQGLKTIIISIVLLSVLIHTASALGVASSFYNIPLAIAQGNESNISSGSQVGNITNMTSPNENLTDSALENATQIKNITEISNATAGEAIPLQQIVTLKSSAPDSAFNDLVNEVKSKGAEIIHSYKELLNAFAFRAPNDRVLTDIVTDLKNNSSVESVIPDKTAGIMPE